MAKGAAAAHTNCRRATAAVLVGAAAIALGCSERSDDVDRPRERSTPGTSVDAPAPRPHDERVGDEGPKRSAEHPGSKSSSPTGAPPKQAERAEAGAPERELTENELARRERRSERSSREFDSDWEVTEKEIARRLRNAPDSGADTTAGEGAE